MKRRYVIRCIIISRFNDLSLPPGAKWMFAWVQIVNSSAFFRLTVDLLLAATHTYVIHRRRVYYGVRRPCSNGGKHGVVSTSRESYSVDGSRGLCTFVRRSVAKCGGIAVRREASNATASGGSRILLTLSRDRAVKSRQRQLSLQEKSRTSSWNVVHK